MRPFRWIALGFFLTVLVLSLIEPGCASRRRALIDVMGHNQKTLFELQSHAGDPIEADAIRADLDKMDGGLASLTGDADLMARVAAARETMRELRAAEWTSETRHELYLRLEATCKACHEHYPSKRALPRLAFDHRAMTSKPSPEACGSCHGEVVDEWKKTLHAQAWTDTVYQMSIGSPPKRECVSCHIPEPILFADFDVSYGYRPFIRSENLDDAVGCVSCHLRADGTIAAGRSADAPCRPVKDARVRSPEFCGACHNPTHDAYYEWKTSAACRAGTSCVDCHMPPVERKDGRKGFSHVFPGGDHSDFVKKSVKISCSVETGELVIRVENLTSHKFPGEVPTRVFIVTIKHDGAEEDLKFRRPNKQEVGWKDNRLAPDETRVLRWKIPDGTKSLRVEFWFQQSPFMRPRGWINLGSWERKP